MPSARKQSGYAAKRDAGRVPARYSDRYHQWHAAARSGRGTAEEHAAWMRKFRPGWRCETDAAGRVRSCFDQQEVAA